MLARKSYTDRRLSQMKTTLRRIHEYRQIYLLILPAFIYTFIFHYVPIYGIQITFKYFRPSLGITGSEWIGLQNFARFITYPDFWKMIRNTLGITLYTLATFPCPIILALMFNELQSDRTKKVYQTITYAPHFLSTVVVCSLVTSFLDRSTGLVNNILELLGMNRIDFLSESSMFASIYVWSGVWQNAGWDSILYIAALSSVAIEIVEAARIDGANHFGVIWHVYLPGILPTIIIRFILSTGSMLSVGFEKIFLLQNDLNLDASRVISTYTYEIGIIGAQFSYSAAIGLFNNVVNILILLIVNSIAKRISETGLW